MSDSHWASQYYLGSYANEESAKIDSPTHDGKNQFRDRFFAENPDPSKFYSLKSSQMGTFFHWQANTKRICILGNCQSMSIARHLSQMALEPVSVAGIEIMTFQQHEAEIASIISSSDIVFACSTNNPIYQKVSPDYIRTKMGKDTFEYCPLYYSGFHPDIIVLGNYSSRLNSPLGAYNSRLILLSFLKGLNPDECIKLFNGEVFESLGYFTCHEQSLFELKRRDQGMEGPSVSILDWFISNMNIRPTLYTINHPTDIVLSQYAALFLKSASIRHVENYCQYAPSPLSNDTVWPIYPEIKKVRGISFDTGQLFWRGMNSISLEDLIWRSYQSYDDFGKRNILNLTSSDASIEAQIEKL